MIEMGKLQFGEPWKYRKNSVTVVVPILKKEYKERNYKTIEEVKEKLEIKDGGKISEVEISSKTDEPTFIRSGTMFEGKGTQSRGLTTSIVVMPKQEKVKAEVRCIHASHPIRHGSSFNVSGSAPSHVGNLLCYGASQSRVWSAISSWTASSYSGTSGLGTIRYADNLVDSVRKIGDFKKEVDDIIKEYPVLNDQVGIVVLDFNGVVGLELFDHPNSWKAVCNDIIKKYSDSIKVVKTSIYKLNEETIKPKIEEFIGKLINGDEEEVFRSGNAKTMILKSEGILGEYTMIDNVIIHLSGFKIEKEDKEEERRIPERTLGDTWIGVPPYRYQTTSSSVYGNVSRTYNR